MTAAEQSRGSSARKGAVLLALRYYGRQMAGLWRFTVPAMLLPALGNTCIFYVAPLNPFHPGYASRVCNTWMALASRPAFQGQQRSFWRIFHVLSWAFARSPGARSFACARLASFWDCGLFLPL